MDQNSTLNTLISNCHNVFTLHEFDSFQKVSTNQFFHNTADNNTSSTKDCIKCQKTQIAPNFLRKSFARSVPRLHKTCNLCAVKSLRNRKRSNLHAIKRRIKEIFLQISEVSNNESLTLKETDSLDQRFLTLIYFHQSLKCIYCHKLMMTQGIRSLSLVRANLSQGYDRGNVLLCCKRCQMLRSDDYEHQVFIDMFLN